jgi:hypothetical protein
MNERIRELAEQAGCDWWEGRAQRDMTRCDTELQKFAELIVRQCADVAWMNTPETEELEYSHLISNKIKQHFGVEE